MEYGNTTLVRDELRNINAATRCKENYCKYAFPGVFRTPVVVLAFRKNPGCWKLTYTTSLWAFFSENSPEYVTKLYFKWLLNRVLFLYIKRFFSCVSKLSIQRRNFSVGKLKLSPSFCLVLVFEKIDEMFRRSMLVTDKNFLKIHCC